MNRPFHRRSQRLLLHVVVLIKTEMPEGVPQQAQGFTESVSAHGGVLDAPFRMSPGQHLTLINPVSGREASGRVVRVGAACGGYFPTAFEFYDYNPQFWPVSVVPADWSASRRFSEEKR
jgi:hypothetical protein